MKTLSLSINQNGNFDFNKNHLTLNNFIKSRNDFILKLRKFNNTLNVSICIWDYHYGKGFDDFILNTNNINGFIYLPFSEFLYKLSFIFEELIGNSNVSQDEFFSLFKEYLLEDYVDLEIANKIEQNSMLLDNQHKENKKGEMEIVPF